MTMNSAGVARALGAELRARGGGAALEFRRVIIDSRLAQRGDLFVALRGERADGHDFIADAAERGVAGVVVDRPVSAPPNLAVFEVSDGVRALQLLAADHRGRSAARVVGVTGSVGKTSCKELIASVLSARYRVHRNEANQNNEIGLPLAVLALNESHQIAVLEMGMYAPGEIATLAAIARPEVGVVTNVGSIHLERLGSIEAIADAKAELVEALPKTGVAVLNGDDERVAAMARRSVARALLYGSSPWCQVRGVDQVRRGLEGSSFRLIHEGREVEVVTPLPGPHGMQNALAAAAVALSFDLGLDDIATALAKARPYRLSVLAGPNGSTLLDDTYNASPPSVLAALDLLAELPGRRIAVLGDMLELGTLEEEGHREVGERAAAVVDLLVAVGPRAAVIAAAARAAGLGEVRQFDDRSRVARFLIGVLGDGDQVLFKGSRAMALETVIDEIIGAASEDRGGERRRA